MYNIFLNNESSKMSHYGYVEPSRIRPPRPPTNDYHNTIILLPHDYHPTNMPAPVPEKKREWYMPKRPTGPKPV